MSRRRGVQHRRRPRRQHHDDETYAVTMAWAPDEARLEEARRVSHDQLIAMMGASRTGGVRWLQVTDEEATVLLGQMYEGADQAQSDAYRRMGAHLREYGGWLVVAMAPGRPPQ